MRMTSEQLIHYRLHQPRCQEPDAGHLGNPCDLPLPCILHREFKTDGEQLVNEGLCVIQRWAQMIPLREQGTLLTCVRGCDVTPKLPLDSTERRLVAFLRFCFMVPADPREVNKETGCFFLSHPPHFKASELGHYPLHWYSHVMHAAEVIGYRHPTPRISRQAGAIYFRLAESLHMTPETFEQFEARLSVDRLVAGNIVS